MKPTQGEKAARFRALHAGPGIFVMPNPWDIGSARMLVELGFQALATSSAAAAAVVGLEDGQLDRAMSLAHAQGIVEACDVPVSADLGDGFGKEPETVAETIRLAAAAGLAGASIEDAPASGGPPYDLRLAVQRIEGAAEAAKALPFPFTLTARAENFILGLPDLEDTIARLRAFERAGADVLFAPGLPTLDAVRAVCSAVFKPVNFMAGVPTQSFSVSELEAVGVRRVSLGSSLYRAAMRRAAAAAREVSLHGTFQYVKDRPD